MFHLHTGPGHHHNLLIHELQKRGYNFSISKNYPKYSFSDIEAGVIKHTSTSTFADKVKWLTWGLASRINFLKKKNRHLLAPYSVYDRMTARKMKENQEVVMAWAQVSKWVLKKSKARLKVLDYPIPHINEWNRVMNEEAQIIGRPLNSLFSASMKSRMLQEIELADHITVPSPYVYNSFLHAGVPEEKLILNPYGIDASFFTPDNTITEKKGKIKAVFVGSIECRKGVHYLLDAANKLDPDFFKIILIGSVKNDMFKDTRIYNLPHVEFKGQMTQDEIRTILQQADVTVMPSLCEGLSLTILESMAMGLPVISSHNAGGVGLIEHNVDGFIVPIRSSEAIANTLEWVKTNRQDALQMGIRARKKIENAYKIEDYCDRFVQLILNNNANKLERGN